MTAKNVQKASQKPKHAGGRPRTGSLYWTKSGWRARLTVDVDGVPIQKSFDLKTTNKAAARAKLKRLGEEQAPPEALAAKAERSETAWEAMKRIVERQGGEGLKTWKERLSRLQRYAAPEIGPLGVGEVRSAHIREVLEAAGSKGLSRQSVTHLRNDLSGVFDDLWRDEVIAENPVARCRLPKGLPVDKRPRVILTDDEFQRFASSEVVPERLYLMSLVSRCFGGMRTSDLHAWDWQHIDTETWQSAEVYRPKTDGDESGMVLVRLVMPELICKPLEAWWSRQGRPSLGPVFPLAAGKRAGERQGKRSHVRDLRRYLWDAGVHRPVEGYDKAMAELRKATAALDALAKHPKGREKRTEALAAVKVAEDAAKARCAIQSDQERTRAADFHSFRRAFNTALGAAGVNVQVAMALAGHRDPRTHLRYVDLSQRGALPMPAAALPVVSARPVQELEQPIASGDHAPKRKSRKPRGFRDFQGGDPNEI